MQALRGLRTLALAALTVTLLGASAGAAINLLPNSGFTDGLGGLDGWSTTLTPPGTETCCSAGPNFEVTAPGAVNGPFDGTGPFYIDFNHAITLGGNVYSSAPLAFTWNPNADIFFAAPAPRIFSVQIVDGLGAVVATLYSAPVSGSDFSDHPVSIDVAATLNTLPAGAYTFRFDSFIPEDHTGPATMTISALSFTAEVVPTQLYVKGDLVPGVTPPAIFTGFGVPAINAAGKVAFLGKWSGGSGIFADGVLVAKVGDVLSGTTAIKSMKDPVIDDAGHVAFPAALIGAVITSANDSALISNAPGGTLAIVAQEGTAAPGTGGALWKSFQSLAAPGGGGGVLILGTLVQGGAITSANDSGVWSANASGVLSLVLQEGTTVIATKTVKSFKALKSVSGTPGQTHAFNGSGELVAQVAYTTGEQALVHIPLP